MHITICSARSHIAGGADRTRCILATALPSCLDCTYPRRRQTGAGSLHRRWLQQLHRAPTECTAPRCAGAPLRAGCVNPTWGGGTCLPACRPGLLTDRFTRGWNGNRTCRWELPLKERKVTTWPLFLLHA